MGGVDQLIVDLAVPGNVSVSVSHRGTLQPSVLAEQEFSWPLSEDDHEDLRWYLEEYLSAPFGVYEERGARVAAALGDWGHSVFASVFGSGAARDLYLEMRTRGDVELVFRSSSPSLLGLPWELMADPGRPGPLALEIAGVSRSLPVEAESAEVVPAPGRRLRVLMVISRPAGAGDVGYQMIARPLLRRLEAVRGQVGLVVLRPPTLDALRSELASATAAGTPYQVVHFDGHGVFRGSKAVGGGEGMLVFEAPGGGAHYVSATEIASVVRHEKIPVVVLNACQSGAVGKQLEAAVATGLLRGGVASVVAMAYTVYAVAAAEFMAAFYERLFAGGTVSSAVTAGRQQLYRTPGRPSPKGELPLADWVIPVLYLRRQVSFPQAAVSRPAGLSPLPEALAQVSASIRRTGADGGQGLEPEPVAGELDAVDGVFVGRDALFYELEAAARWRKVVVLVGPGGTGKTELAKAFGRWWRDTGGVEQPDRVFWHSFAPGVASFGLDGVITEIGLALFGSDFARQEADQRLAVVRKALAEHRMLLIWDNFESVWSMAEPDRATPPLDEKGRAELCVFLADLAASGESTLLITSRTSEDWLGDIQRVTVGGLAAHEAIQYADILLARYPAARTRRAGREFGELMRWLDGHPLSMRLVLPRLDTATPGVVLAALRDASSRDASLWPDAGAGTDRTKSLDASVAYSYAHLANSARRLLPVVSLLYGVADAAVLVLLSGVPDAIRTLPEPPDLPSLPDRFARATRQDWVDCLDDAARVGLLADMGAERYRIHPALPGYLATAWRAEDPDGHDAIRAATSYALMLSHGGLGVWLKRQIESGGAELAYQIIGLELRNLGWSLGHALDQGQWDGAQQIIQALEYYWDSRGLEAEADAWIGRVRHATETPDGTPPELDTDAGALWLYAIGREASRELGRRHLDAAERAYRTMMAMIQARDASPSQRRRLAVAYSSLGTIELERMRLPEADHWSRQAIAIEEERGDRAALGKSYHQLGNVAWRGGHYADAEDWYRKALALFEQASDRERAGGTYHQLGVVAEERSQHEENPALLAEAARWQHKALAIFEKLGDRTQLVGTYHHLGNLAFRRGRLDEAEEWYRRALAIEEEPGTRPDLASTYHGLGVVAQERGRLAEAFEWYRKSVAIAEEVGDQVGIALSFCQFGLLAEAQGKPAEAMSWMIRSACLLGVFPHPATRPAPDHIVRLVRLHGMPLLEQCWKQVTGNALPGDVRALILKWQRQLDASDAPEGPGASRPRARGLLRRRPAQ